MICDPCRWEASNPEYFARAREIINQWRAPKRKPVGHEKCKARGDGNFCPCQHRPPGSWNGKR